MSSGLRSYSVRGIAQLLKLFSALTLLAFALNNPLSGQLFVADDFNDGNDNGWSHYDPLAQFGLNASYTIVNGGYRMRTPYVTGMAANPGRAGTLRAEIYTDFYVSIDIVNWDDTLPQSVGLLARIRNAGLQTTTGYAFTWDRGNPASATAGDVDISRITGEAPAGVSVTGSDVIHLEPGKSYRLVFVGRGANLEGRVYELPNITTAVIAIAGIDATYADGQSGMVVFDNNQGRSQTDATFDNYYATDIEPPILRVQDIFFGYYRLSWPLDRPQFVLERSSVLPGTAADWQTVAGVTQDPNNGAFVFDVDTSLDGPMNFYRLVRR
jgi:hypothetical protein